jgi:hypothetical protein
MADDPNQTWVAMRHPDIDVDDASVVTKAAFDEVWSDKGWQMVAGSEANAQDLVDVTAGRKSTRKAPTAPKEA